MEVNHESDGQVGEPQIRQRLRKMDRQHSVDRLHFDDDGTLHQQIEAIHAIQRDSLVDQWDTLLSEKPNPAVRQFVLQAGRVGGFEQARPQQAVNFDSGRDDVAREIAERNRGEHTDESASDGPSGRSAISE